MWSNGTYDLVSVKSARLAGFSLCLAAVLLENPLSLDRRNHAFVFSRQLTGMPAISFPAGRDSKGLPIWMHASGRAWEEHQLLGLALTAERILAHLKPELSFSLISD